MSGSARIVIAAYLPASDGLYHGRYPLGNISKPLGINLNHQSSFSPEYAFINIVKGASGSYTNEYKYCNWIMAKGVDNSTDVNEADLLIPLLNSDGYPSSVNGASVGGTFTCVYAAAFSNLNAGPLPPGMTTWYPGGSYSVDWTGTGTVQIKGDGVITTSTSGSTFTVTPTNYGLRFGITSGSITNLRIYRTSQASNLNSGQIFTPEFLGMVGKFTCFRFMDWRATNGKVTSQFPVLVVSPSANVSAGATSFTMSGGQTWRGATGTYTALFYDAAGNTSAESKQVTLTCHSGTVSWTGGLAKPQNTANVYILTRPKWAGRSLPSNCFYSGIDGVPFEICIALCNTVGADCWLNLPLEADSTYMNGLHNLVHAGTGAQAGNAIWTSGLNAPYKLYSEVGNENWNSTFLQPDMSSLLCCINYGDGGGGYKPSNQGAIYNWNGAQCALNSDAAFSAWGSDFARCIPVLGTQTGNEGVTTGAMASTIWTAGKPASGHHIKAIAGHSYFTDTAANNSYMSQVDIVAIVSQPIGTDSTAGLTYLFAAMTSNVGGALTSLNAGGFLAMLQTYIQNAKATATSYGLPWVSYEGGQSFVPGSEAGNFPNLTGVSITGTSGQFSCNAASTSIKVGHVLSISGTFGGTGSISGYTDPTQYAVSATNGSTTFTLVQLNGTALVTTAGTPTGLTYARGLTAAQAAAWNACCLAAQTDARMLTTYGNWFAMVNSAGAPAIINHFSDCTGYSANNGYWGLVNNTMQTVGQPQSSMPIKYQWARSVRG